MFNREIFEQFLSELTKEEIEELNNKDIEETNRIYDEWKTAFDQDMCSLCHKPLSYVDTINPCLHLLIYPKLKKKIYLNILDQKSLFQVYSYLRWVANTENILTNINDLKLESNEKNMLQVTIKYKDFTWGIICSKGDLEGHQTNNVSFPHYHFQMEYEGQSIIKFNQTHIKLTDEDIFNLILKNEYGAKEYSGHGSLGMNSLFDLEPEELINTLGYCEEDYNAPIHIQTVASFEDGIDGEELYELVQRAKKEGITVASLLRDRADSATSFIEPGKAVPKMKKRKKRGK